jgi:hypothetical protein
MSPGAAPHRPLGVSLLIWVFWFWAGAIVLFLLGLAIGDGPVMVNGRAVARGEALRVVLPALAPMGLAVVGAALALSLGRWWARPAALLPFVLAALGPVLTGVGGVSAWEVVGAALVLIPLLAGLAWYLYRRPGPRRYLGRRRP